MNNYQAIVVKLGKIRKHSNADRLMCTTILTMNVIVGLDCKEGDLGLFFPLESQLGKEFAETNDLIRRKDENGKSVGGMFDKNRRVRTQILRGEKSMGFYCPLSFLEKTGVSLSIIEALKEGDSFNELDGIKISSKYMIKRKNDDTNGKTGKQPKKKRISKLVNGQFKFHFDTEQFYKNLHKIKPDDVISISWKKHGTSGICSHVLCNKKLKFYEKVLLKLGVKLETLHYDYLYASRKVIKNEYDKESSHYYDEDLWSKAGEKFKGLLRKGETVYFEILGYTSCGAFIQKGYDYKVPLNQFKIEVYRMTSTNVDGQTIELSWNQVKHRCEEIGVDFVEEIFYGKAKEFVPFEKESWFNTSDLKEWHEELNQRLQTEYVYDQDSKFCYNKVPEEGVVIRIEHGDGIVNYKMKSYRFYEMETKQLDNNEVDIESEE